MNCLESLRSLDAYVDDELDAVAALALEEHLRGCARCRAQEAGLRALRSALQRAARDEPAPQGLRRRLQARRGSADAPSSVRRLGAVVAAAALAALATWFGVAREERPQPRAGAQPPRIVYHIASSASAGAALRTLRNHLEAAPGVRVVVVAHNEGVDFLLRGARDSAGELYEPLIRAFRERGVDFRVCNNTLARRRIGPEELVPGATLVPSGIAEIGRLQAEEGYLYLRL
jgi:intracellular sulfur oxidation DsrE/DsrF family protein